MEQQPSDGTPDGVSTLSQPERPAYVLIYSLLGFTALLVLTTTVLAPEESGLADLVLAFSVIGTTALLCTVLTKASVVHLEASAEEGLTMSMGHVVTRNLPWEAIASIEEAPSGGSFDVAGSSWAEAASAIWPGQRRCW